MSPVARRILGSVTRRLDQATAHMEEAADSGYVGLIGEAFAEVLLAKGELAAVLQLIDLEEGLGKADTQRPDFLPPKLELVKP